MAKPPLSRETLLPLLVAHVMQHGLGGASLRPLAKAAGTSDRMLIYHFGNKERLVADVLNTIADIYAAGLEASLGGETFATRSALLHRLFALTRDAAMQAFIGLWWEIVAGAARDLPGYRDAAQEMMRRQVEWLEGHMPAGDPDPAGGARQLMIQIEGALMLDTVGHGEMAQAGLLAAARDAD